MGIKCNLSDSEWIIMHSLWNQAPKTITELVAELKIETSWSKSTVITMLRRMEVKKAVYYEEGRKAKFYFPSFAKEEAATEETTSFLRKVYDGSLGLMVNSLMEQKALTKEDISELYEILKKAEEDHNV